MTVLLLTLNMKIKIEAVEPVVIDVVAVLRGRKQRRRQRS